jgi:hypothetical protein
MTNADSQGPSSADSGEAALPSLADPEEGVRFATAEEAAGRLSEQLKGHLLLSQHVLLPLGYLFDSPALWHLLESEPDLVALLLERQGARSSVLIVAKPDPSERHLDANFDAWFRGSPERARGMLNPSVLRTPWAASVPSAEAAAALQQLREANRPVQFADYVARLGLSAPVSLVARLLACDGIALPPDRHAAFLERLRTELPKLAATGNAAAAQLLPILRDPARERVTRSELQNLAPAAWNQLQPFLNAWRRDVYFTTFRGRGITHPPLGAWFDDALRESPLRAQDIRHLPFATIARIRRADEFAAVMSRLASCPRESPEDWLAYAGMLRAHWAPCLERSLSSANRES